MASVLRIKSCGIFPDITLSALFNPPLTTVRQLRLLMGQSAVRILLERMEKPNLKPRQIMLTLEMVERQTAGTPKIR